MSDDTVDTGSDTDDTIVTETQDATRQASDKPAGYHPVDPETASPEQVKDRLDYLYRQVKDQERTNREYKTITQQQAQAIDDLMNGVGRVVDHLTSKDAANTEAEINDRMQQAFESGDTKTYLAEQQKLIQLEAQKIVAQQQKPQQQNRTQTQQMAYAGASQMANEAVSEGSMAPEEAQYVNAWQDEKDERGQPLRPWSKTSDPNDPDPDFVKMQIVAAKVWKENPNRSVKENLAEVDKRMGVTKRAGGQSVMGGSLNTPGKRQTMTLSPELQRLAVRTKFGGPKAKSDADHIEAYRKQIEKVQSSKGSR